MKLTIGLVLVLCACVPADEPGIGAAQEELLAPDVLPKDSAWILHPAFLDEEHHGTSNCAAHLDPTTTTFAFGQNRGCALEVQHAEDFACQQRAAGHDGWLRQHIQQMHCASTSLCGGGPGDFSTIRVCRDQPDATGNLAGQASVCGPTGPAGCANCILPTFTCH